MSQTLDPSSPAQTLASDETERNRPQNPCKTLHSTASADAPPIDASPAEIDPNYRLSNAQSRAIQLALDGHRWADIAQTLGVHTTTLWRWKKHNPDFRNAFADAKLERERVAAQRAQSVADRATSALLQVVNDPTHKDRVRAAQILLQNAHRLNPPAQSPPLTPDYGPSAEYPHALITPPPPRKPEPDLEPKVG